MSFNFDLNEVEEFSGGVIPAGTYPVTLEQAEVKETKDGSGLFIQAMFTVTGENQTGRKFWEMFNIKNTNEKAVQIGLGRIKSLIVAAGGSPGLFNDEQALVGLECMAKLTVKSDEYGEKNRVVGFSPCENEYAPEGKNEESPF